jgi:hypothetical protein
MALNKYSVVPNETSMKCIVNIRGDLSDCATKLHQTLHYSKDTVLRVRSLDTLYALYIRGLIAMMAVLNKYSVVPNEISMKCIVNIRGNPSNCVTKGGTNPFGL